MWIPSVVAIFLMSIKSPALAQRTSHSRDLSCADLQAAAATGEVVEFRGQVESDGIERTAIIPVGCRSLFLQFDIPASISKKAWSRDLDNAIYSGHPGTVDKEISADFTGHISLHTSLGTGTLHISHIAHVQVIKKLR